MRSFYYFVFYTFAVRELATFHGEMYALKDSNSKLFKDIVSRLAEARWSNDEIMEEYNIKLITCRYCLMNICYNYN